MNLMERINADFMVAYKNKEMDKKNFLGVIKGEVTKATKTPSDDEIISVLRSMIKNNDKSMLETGGISSLTEDEVMLINSYLPVQMSEEVVREIVGVMISEGSNNLGQIMGKFNKEYTGKADNNLVKQVALEMLG